MAPSPNRVLPATSAEHWLLGPGDDHYLMWHVYALGVVADLATLTSDTDGALIAQPSLLRLPARESFQWPWRHGSREQINWGNQSNLVRTRRKLFRWPFTAP